jgi:hypothetical protein
LGRIPTDKRKDRKNLFLCTAQLLRKTNLTEIFSEARSGTIAHKNQNRITAGPQCLSSLIVFTSPPPSLINWHKIVGVLHPSWHCVFSDTHRINNFCAPTRDAHCTDVEDHFEDGSRPISEFQDPALDFHGLTAIQYQGDIIQWLQREYGDHVQVHYTLYKDYRNAENQGRQIYPNTEPISPNYSSYTRL